MDDPESEEAEASVEASHHVLDIELPDIPPHQSDDCCIENENDKTDQPPCIPPPFIFGEVGGDLHQHIEKSDGDTENFRAEDEGEETSLPSEILDQVIVNSRWIRAIDIEGISREGHLLLGWHVGARLRDVASLLIAHASSNEYDLRGNYVCVVSSYLF